MALRSPIQPDAAFRQTLHFAEQSFDWLATLPEPPTEAAAEGDNQLIDHEHV